MNVGREICLATATWLWNYISSRPQLVQSQWSEDRWHRVITRLQKQVPSAEHELRTLFFQIQHPSVAFHFPSVVRYIVIQILTGWNNKIKDKAPEHGITVIVNLICSAMYAEDLSSQYAMSGYVDAAAVGDDESSSSSSGSDSDNPEEDVTGSSSSFARVSDQKVQDEPLATAAASQDWNAMIAYYHQNLQTPAPPPVTSMMPAPAMPPSFMPLPPPSASYVTTYTHPPILPYMVGSQPATNNMQPPLATKLPDMPPPQAAQFDPAKLSADLARMRQQAAKQWAAPSGPSSLAAVGGVPSPRAAASPGLARGLRGPAAAAASKYQAVDVLCQDCDE